jgi:ribonuclease HI
MAQPTLGALVAENDRVFLNHVDDRPACVVYIDGGCSGNGQLELTKRRMVAVVSDEAGSVVVVRERDGGSNNIAELWAVAEALEWAAERKIPVVEIRTDSRNNFSWTFGRKLGKDINDRAAVEALQSRVTSARRLVVFRLVWVPREENLAGHYIERHYGL